MGARATTTTTARSGGATAVITPQADAWDALSRAYAAVSLRLQEALSQNDFPPLPWFELLAAVAAAPEQRMRMGELAEALVMTRGGLTKLVDRLVKAGLLERTFCETDRRVSYATLLPAGAELLAEMRPVIAGELELTFSDQLGAREARELRSILERLRSSACGG
ncbi:MAG: MarR family transcriptional regulator [Solirubrobacterales bacterium]